MDTKRVAALIVSNYILNDKRGSARRLKLLKEQRNRRRRAFLRRQTMVRLMFVVLMSVAHCNQSPDRMIWMKEE